MKKQFEEFKKFAFKGNMFDLAVGVIIGTAFGAVVTSLVNDLIMPIFGLIIGGLDFASLSIDINDVSILYGNLIQTIVNFFIIALCVFFFIRLIGKFTKKQAKEEAPPPKPEVKSAEVQLLEEIRDLLKDPKDLIKDIQE